MMNFIPRKVQTLSDTKDDSQKTSHEIYSLEGFRQNPAWVLLGEPGAGKTSAFEEEAKAVNGKHIRIAEFIASEHGLDPDWRNKVLFLDGLDETRTNGRDRNTLIIIRQKLKKLGNPFFRIACRAADWYGAMDSNDLKSAAHEQKITVLQLVPFDEEETAIILQNNHGYGALEADIFLKKARQYGIFDLLSNPQILEMLVKAVDTHQWPKTRHEIFQLACEKLVYEHDPYHRVQTRTNKLDKNKLLAAAGQLCAVLLLADQTGLALDEATQSFPTVDDCIPSDMQAAMAAVRSKLFKLEQQEKVVPYHRNIAEYLAAQWLANQIDIGKFPAQRLLNLLLGTGDCAIAGLRGLYGWLASVCQTLRRQLIEADPLTVFIYGDIAPMSLNDKRHILEKLYDEATKNRSFLYYARQTQNFVALAVPELQSHYKAILQSEKRDAASQAYVSWVMIILSQSNKLDLQTELLTIIGDDSYQSTIRADALKLWLKKANSTSALELLTNVIKNKVVDNDDDLAGLLLAHLYPEYIRPENLLTYLHPSKNPNYISYYAFFWTQRLASESPNEHLPVLMGQLVNYSLTNLTVTNDKLRFRKMANALLLRSIKLYGDTIDIDKLYAWLSIDVSGEDQTEIQHWLEARPEKYEEIQHKRTHWKNQADSEQMEYKKKCEEEKQKRTQRIQQYLSLIHSGDAPAMIMYELAGVWEKRFLEVRGNTVADRFNDFYHQGAELLPAAEAGFKRCLLRGDLPAVDEIIALHLNQKEHFLSIPCLIGLDLLWQSDQASISNIADDILMRLIAFHLTAFLDKTQPWFNHFLLHRPSLVAKIVIQYANAKLKVKKYDYINAIYALEHDINYKEVAILALPELLKKFPVRVKIQQLNILGNLLRSALHYKPDILPAIVALKITKKGMDIPQKIYWQFTHALLTPIQENYDALWCCVGNTESHVKHLATFLQSNKNYYHELPVSMVGKLIELIAPFAKLEWKLGFANDAEMRGYEIQKLVDRLSATSTEESAQELARLQALDKLKNIKPLLQDAYYEQQRRWREQAFSFLNVKEVAKTLANKAPANVADLAALTLDIIDNIAKALRTENDNGTLEFWEFDKQKKLVGRRHEELCRNALLHRLRNSFSTYGVDCQPEGNYVNDKYADIRLSFHAQFELPIEIKCDDNRDLWNNLRKQLINQYSIAPRASGYGIYLVLWFGGEGIPRDNITGGKKPRSPEELKARLEAQLDSEECKRIFVRVIDASLSGLPIYK